MSRIKKKYGREHPEKVRLFAKRMRKYWKRPEARMAQSKRTKEYAKKHPKAAKRHGMLMRRYYGKGSETAKRHSKFMRTYWTSKTRRREKSKVTKKYYKTHRKEWEEREEEMRETWKNPELKKTQSKKTTEYSQKHPDVGRKHSESMQALWRNPKYRERHKNWKGGISYEPYGFEFNDKLKEQIMARDKHRCQKCGKKYELIVHHIDYNKKNNKSKNLISLCRECHGLTNYNRKYWTKYYRHIIAKRKL
jgi:hypothetical protein